MGTAWHSSASYPWEHGVYVKGIETVKVNIMLRIYSNKWHVYAGLAILNPWARIQIDQYAKSVTELFKLMVGGDGEAFRRRVYEARDKVFGHGSGSDKKRAPILLEEDILDQFSLLGASGTQTSQSSNPKNAPVSPTAASRQAAANSHLALLAMVDCWGALGIRPFHHLDLAATPVFRMWIGVAEYLFRSTSRLDSAIHAAMNVLDYRSDDTEFVVAARGWSQCISFGSFDLYRRRFEETSKFFESRFAEATKKGSLMIQAISEASATAAQAASASTGA
jgi:prephenate dehydrogenase (NADP+)